MVKLPEENYNIKPQIMRLIFPCYTEIDWRKEITSNIQNYTKGSIEIDCRDWRLTCKDIKYIESICSKQSIRIVSIESTTQETIISASSLGLKSLLKLENDSFDEELLKKTASLKKEKSPQLFFHQGTLRAGELLEVENDLLVLGDVNPGAKVMAGGDIMIWGRLLGVAHAGKEGNDQAKITALQLRPVQLRIATKIARGPKEKPEEGLAEQAKIERDLIVIKPARTN